MGTTAEKLTYLNTTKQLIKESINLTDANITNEPFRQYATILKHRLPEIVGDPSIIWNNYEHVTGSGTSFSITAYNSIFDMQLKGDTTQNGTPTPSSPIPINVVSGDNTIDICGKNLFNKNTITTSAYLKEDGTLQTGTGAEYVTSDFIPVQPNTTYYKTQTLSPRTKFYDKNKQVLDSSTYQDISIGGNAGSFTTPNNAYYLRFTINVNTSTGININSVMVHKGSTATTYEPYIGESYPISLGVENLCDITNGGSSIGGVPFTIENGVIKINGTTSSSPASNYFNVFQTNSGSAVFSIEVTGYTDKPSGNSALILQQSNDGTTDWSTFSELSLNSVYLKQTIVTLDSSKYYRLRWYVDNNTFTNATIKAQLEYGNKKNSFTPYGTTPIELCKIGNYQDHIYKDNGSWYLHKEIGKVVLNGSERGWGRSGSSSNDVFVGALNLNQYGIGIYSKQSTASYWLVNRFSYGTLGALNKFNVYNPDATYGYNNIGFGISTDIVNDIDTFRTWLASNNLIVYYILATPTNTEITDTTLIDQLEAIKNAVSRKGQTNVSQTNNDLPFILDLSALKEGSDHLVINNAGNIYAMPTMDIEGTGLVNIYLNDVQILEADLSETNNIVIDTESMEAYNPDTNALANRQVTGDYSKIKLEPGENDLRFSGELSKATITDYTRWL